MTVLVRTTRGAGRSVKVAEMRRRASRMMAAMALDAGAELSVLLCDDETIHDLNRRYRGQDRPTDVLAFAMEEGPEVAGGGHRVLGDVVVSVETARRQAATAGRSLVDEVTMLLAHGLLHLLGFDHQSRAEERRMAARTDALRAAAVARAPRRPGSARGRAR